MSTPDHRAGGAGTVAFMSDDKTPDGSTNTTDEQREYTEQLSDGSNTGNATTDPEQDSDIDSGGEPKE